MKALAAKMIRLPPRLLNEAPADGPSQGWVVQLEPMLKEYYRGRGWDENGVPTPKKLADLELMNLMELPVPA